MAADMAIDALIERAIFMAARDADGSINEANARKILREVQEVLQSVSLELEG